MFLLTAAVMLCLASCSPRFLKKVYEVRFEPDGGILVSGELVQKVRSGEAAEEPVVERDGYKFDGWDQETGDVEEDMVVTAKWIGQCNITFDPNGGEIVGGEEKQKVYAGETPVPPEVERKYAELEGWDPEIGAVDRDTTYVAQWKWRELSSKEIYELISPAVPVIHIQRSDGGESLGSGFFVDDQGTLVTNYHVIDTGIDGTITFPEGDEYDILGVKDYDEKKDLAVLEIDCIDNPYLWISDKEVVTGETVYTLGAPLGLDDTFSSGIISKASRDIDGINFIQTTAPISQGNSGGPLVDVYGDVIGINSMTTNEGQNLNFAIDIDELTGLNREGDAEMTLAELNDEIHPHVEEQYSRNSRVYQNADKEEVESNDSLVTADRMDNEVIFAGAVPNDGDVDFYYIHIEEDGKVGALVFPENSEDADHLNCIVLEVTEDDFNVAAVLEKTEEDGTVFLQGLVDADKDRLYFLCITADDEYSVKTPIFYNAISVW